ncbi:MAG: UDP-N-acetylmuramoyl-L-alanyl-D-glutamate--2,6-diaminopimelate ligase [Pseudomonadota bacterium]
MTSAALHQHQVTGLAEHTSEVQPGFGFVAAAKDADRVRTHAQQAIAAGAKLIIVDRQSGVTETRLGETPVLQMDNLGQQKGAVAKEFYADPSARMKCIGVTGTNGKTSIAYHVADLLEKTGRACGYCGTLGVGSLRELTYDDGTMTTPNAVALQRLLAELERADAHWCAMEISSHALDQKRAHDVNIECAIYSNLSRDHLDYHGTMQAYAQAKARLFTDFALKSAVINIEDEYGRELVSTLAGTSVQVITYGQGGDWSWHRDGRQVIWNSPVGEFYAELNLIADYQIANVTSAMAAITACGVGYEAWYPALAGLRDVPGRMQMVQGGAATQPDVVVDFAHTPDALEKVLNAVKPHCAGQLICIVGCGGDRDKGKRPQMAAGAAEHSHAVWLTSDNPRSEDPQAIVDDMLAGLDEEQRTRCRIEVDREQAIRQAIIQADTQDLVVIAGKGHETYQEIGAQKLPFDDAQMARKYLNTREAH